MNDLAVQCPHIRTTYIHIFQIDGTPLGSCEYEASKLLTDLEGTGYCDQLVPEGQACALPLNPGTYAPGDSVIEITLPDIPPILIPFLGGDIDATVVIKLADGTEIICLHVLIELNNQ